MPETLKGSKDWSSFLREMAEEYAALKREKVRKELKGLFESSFGGDKVEKVGGRVLIDTI